MKNKVVIALGGNALGDTNKEQIEAVNQAVSHIVDLIEDNNEVVIVHGNGPQVGKIQLAFSTGAEYDSNLEAMPLGESIAMSQGYIGYHLQMSLINELKARSIDKAVGTVLTHAVVDAKDSSFENPTKPIGPFYSLDEVKAKGYANYVEDSGRGYRLTVASPLPTDLLEKDIIKDGLQNDRVIICAGGGGIPVVLEDNKFNSVDAVIDKDASAALVAELVDADTLIILTAVNQVALNYNTPEEKWLSQITLSELEQYIKEDHFAPGSMLPKVEAAQRFVSSSSKAKAIITSLSSAKDAIRGLDGTVIVSE